MVLLLQKTSELLVCVENKIIKYNVATDEEEVIPIPQLVTTKNLKKGQEALQTRSNIITTASLSDDNEYLTLSTTRKQLVVYNENFDVVKNVLLERVASKVRFTPKGDILVADKTGDAFIYKLNDEENVPELLLGHLSMLLDILVTKCCKYIVTCDRDEKIRVSHFPNAYNIKSYCLGHKEFVTNVDVVEDVLISASGDGTIRFWNFLTGEELHVISTNTYIKNKEVVDSFCKKMDRENCEVSCLPVTDMQVFVGDNVYVAASLFNYEAIQIYLVENICTNQISSKLIQNITFDSSLISFSLNENLFVLTNSSLCLYCLENRCFKLISNEALNAFYLRNQDVIRKSISPDDTSKSISPDDISVLYKRKFDNVQEYLERKKQRLQTK